MQVFCFCFVFCIRSFAERLLKRSSDGVLSTENDYATSVISTTLQGSVCFGLLYNGQSLKRVFIIGNG